MFFFFFLGGGGGGIRAGLLFLLTLSNERVVFVFSEVFSFGLNKRYSNCYDLGPYYDTPSLKM